MTYRDEFQPTTCRATSFATSFARAVRVLGSTSATQKRDNVTSMRDSFLSNNVRNAARSFFCAIEFQTNNQFLSKHHTPIKSNASSSNDRIVYRPQYLVNIKKHQTSKQRLLWQTLWPRARNCLVERDDRLALTTQCPFAPPSARPSSFGSSAKRCQQTAQCCNAVSNWARCK